MSSSTVLLWSTVAAFIPALIYVGIIYWIDHFEKEPWWLLTAAFLWGAIPSIVVSFVFNTIFSIPFYVLAGEGAGDALAASLVAPPVEETIKGFALLGILFLWRHEIDSLLDGIIYGALVGMGFAMIENIYYFVNVFNEGGVEAWSVTVFLRAVIFGLNHSLFTSMTGLGIAIARLSPKTSVRILAPIAGWMAAMFLHFVHNASVSMGNLLCFLALFFDWGGVLLVLGIIIGVLLQERRWIKKHLTEEVTYNILTPDQYKRASSLPKRTGHVLRVLFSQGPRAYRRLVHFYHHCSELAYKKHHYTLFQDEKSRELIRGLRQKLVEFNSG